MAPGTIMVLLAELTNKSQGRVKDLELSNQD